MIIIDSKLRRCTYSVSASALMRHMRLSQSTAYELSNMPVGANARSHRADLFDGSLAAAWVNNG